MGFETTFMLMISLFVYISGIFIDIINRRWNSGNINTA